MDYTKFLRVSPKDLLDGAINGIIAAIVIGIYGIVSKGNFDIFTLDYNALIHSIVNWGFAGFISSVGKDFLTTADGKVLGMIKVRN